MSNSTIYQHTPGPWRVVHEDRDLAVVVPGGASLHEWPMNYGQQDVCDAHLIAAAPQLLAFAKKILPLLDRLALPSEEAPAGNSVAADWRDEAIAIIRKATPASTVR